MKKHSEESKGTSFNDNYGLFHWFKARANLHDVKVSGEAASVSADTVTAWEVPEMLPEVTEVPKSVTAQEMVRRCSLSEEGLLVFESQDSKVEQGTKVAAVVQNAIQCCCVIYDKENEKKREQRKERRKTKGERKRLRIKLKQSWSSCRCSGYPPFAITYFPPSLYPFWVDILILICWHVTMAAFTCFATKI